MPVTILDETARLRRGARTSQTGKFMSAKATEDLPAGVFAVRYADGVCDLPDSVADVEDGDLFATLYDPSLPTNADGNEYQSGDMVEGAKRGPVVMISEEALSHNDPVFARIATKGGNTQLGAVRNDADGDGPETVEITVIATGDGDVFHIAINGVLFEYVSGSSETAAQKATAWAALIDAETAFAAAAVGAVITVTPASGQASVDEASAASFLTWAYGADSDAPTAVRVPGARVIGDHTSGLALVAFDSE